MVKDEADIIGYTLQHLSTQVDAILLADNMSSDGTAQIVTDFAATSPVPVYYVYDDVPGYWQSRKMSELAQRAGSHGHTWALCCDADEHWSVHGNVRRTISDFLGGLSPDVSVVNGDLYHYIPALTDDQDEPNPFRRIVWRLKKPAGLPKVCCKIRRDLVIQPGNHGVDYVGEITKVQTGGLTVRHYSWRSEEQYARKIINGAAAYAATDLEEGMGNHWRMFGNPPDEEQVRAHFRTWFWRDEPGFDPDLYEDPAPL